MFVYTCINAFIDTVHIFDYVQKCFQTVFSLLPFWLAKETHIPRPLTPHPITEKENLNEINDKVYFVRDQIANVTITHEVRNVSLTFLESCSPLLGPKTIKRNMTSRDPLWSFGFG